MYKILVPVDFHQTSFSAFNYAAHLALQFPNSEITLLHVINGTFTTGEVLAFEPLLDMEKSALDRLTYFHTDYPAEQGISIPEVIINNQVQFGIPGFSIANMANQEGYDMIIMGARENHGFLGRLLGSTSAIVCRQAQVPIILIHEATQYRVPKKMVFAFDQRSDIEDAVEVFGKINSSINASTTFLHVYKNEKPDLLDQIEDIVEELVVEQEAPFAFEIKSITGDNVLASVKQYCTVHQADMMIMMHRKEGIFGGIFRKQYSIKIAQESILPVMILPEDPKD